MRGAGPRPAAHAWGLLAVVATGVVAITALLAATGVLPGEAVVRAIVRGVSSADMRIRLRGSW